MRANIPEGPWCLVLTLQSGALALARWLRWLECSPTRHRVAGSVPSWGACGSPLMFRSHSDVSLCLSLSQNQRAYPRGKIFLKRSSYRELPYCSSLGSQVGVSSLKPWALPPCEMTAPALVGVQLTRAPLNKNNPPHWSPAQPLRLIAPWRPGTRPRLVSEL